jgi:hypothetical protein
MRLRLREQSVQRKQQSGVSTDGKFWSSGLRNVSTRVTPVLGLAAATPTEEMSPDFAAGAPGFARALPPICGNLKKVLKKVLTLTIEIQYHTRTLLKQTGNFTR